MDPRVLIGRILALLSAILVVVSLFLAATFGASRWEVDRRQSIFLFVVGVVALVAIGVSFFLAPGLAALIAAIGGGLSFLPAFSWILYSAGHLGAGPILGSVAAVGLVAGAIMSFPSPALAELVRRGQREFDQSTTERATATAHLQPPAGWYADPTGEAKLRYWDGRQWTSHVDHQR